MLKSTIGGLITTILFLSCDPHIEFDDRSLDHLYSVNCFISPQDTAHVVWVYKASALGGVANPQQSVERNAIVTISDGIRADTLIIKDDATYYYATANKIHIESGKKYYLTVALADLPLITADCEVPPTPPEPLVEGATVENDFNFIIKWANPTSHPFFVVSATASGTYKRNGPFGPVQIELKAELSERSFPSDNQMQSNQAVGTVKYAAMSDTATLVGRIWNVDEYFLKYYRTFDEYDAWITSAKEPVPLFNQPRAIYSNMKNAVGIFASYNTSQKVIQISGSR